MTTDDDVKRCDAVRDGVQCCLDDGHPGDHMAWASAVKALKATAAPPLDVNRATLDELLEVLDSNPTWQVEVAERVIANLLRFTAQAATTGREGVALPLPAMTLELSTEICARVADMIETGEYRRRAARAEA